GLGEKRNVISQLFGRQHHFGAYILHGLSPISQWVNSHFPREFRMMQWRIVASQNVSASPMLRPSL
ncbi:hypothetical protein OAD55_06765, partial [Planktomarina temperata]|nr:hypothetical protein [Planktomarina temperata]